MARVAVILTAAGFGSRLGADMPKAFIPVGSVPMVIRSADAIVLALRSSAPQESAIVVTAPVADVQRMRDLLGEYGIDALVVAGGQSRAESVLAGLSALPADTEVVLVHDAARCFASPELIASVVHAAELHGTAVPVVRVVDTLRYLDAGHLGGLLDRNGIVAIQTPQGFSRALLQRAFDAAGQRGDLANATDESSLVEALADSDMAIHHIAGDPGNMKVTTAADLEIANARARSVMRCGVGVDAHTFDSASSGGLALAGLVWPDAPALAGHSDGDVAAHALCDALFAAAGLGDLGQQFGVDEPQWSGASGVTLLIESVRRLATQGWQPTSASVQIIGNSPKIGPRRIEAQEVLSAAIGVAVVVSATTTDGMGLTGRGEGLAAIASATVSRVQS